MNIQIQPFPVRITFEATTEQHDRWWQQAMTEESGTLERWITETLDAYTADIQSEREAIQSEES